VVGCCSVVVSDLSRYWPQTAVDNRDRAGCALQIQVVDAFIASSRVSERCENQT
jgi:hypothetical protein